MARFTDTCSLGVSPIPSDQPADTKSRNTCREDHRFDSRLILVLVCSLLVTGSASGQGLEPQNPATETIRGTVINKITNEPIGRALVFSPDNRFATMTDSQGNFEFTFSARSRTDEVTGTGPISGRLITPGQDRPDLLMARKPGFLDDGNARTSTQSAAGKDLTISLTPEALILGRVLLPSGDSQRIQVELYRRQVQDGRLHWVSAGTQDSRSNGDFRFANLAPGSYKLLTRELMDRDPLTFDPRGQLYGYPPVYFPTAASFSSAEMIHLSPGLTFHANITVVRHAYYPVNIKVVNAPAAGMNVSVSAQDGGPGYSLGYDNQRQAIAGILPDGNYTVEAASYGPTPATGLVNITVKGATLEGASMAMVPNGSIPVNVREEFTSTDSSPSTFFWSSSGKQNFSLQGPRRYLNVYLEPVDQFGNGHSSSLHNPTGRQDESLFIENVPPGRYWVRVNSSKGFPSSINYGDIDLQREPLVMESAGSNTPIEITMRDDGAAVEGVVEGIAKQPPTQSGQFEVFTSNPGTRSSFYPSSPHVYLVPTPDGGGEFRDVWVSPEGTFDFQQIPPGVYRVLAFDHPPQELEYRNPAALREFDSKGQVVRLEPGQKEHLQLQVISTSE
jgi:hypothetical protein